MNIFCLFCGNKILDSEIYKKRLRARISQCPRWINFYHCNTCSRHFNYRDLQKHKTLFKKTLLELKM